MSHLTGIEMKNMKGQTAVQPLTGLDIFTGRNGAGKTTRVQALGYAMLGYIPGQKKTAADIFKFSTGDSMSVGLSTDTFQLKRTLNKVEKRNRKSGEVSTSIKESIALSPGAGERTDTERNFRINNELGNFPVMMDFAEFLNMSDTNRRDFIYSLSPITSTTWDREKLHKHLVTKLLTSELQKNNLEQYEAMQELITKAIAEYPLGFGISEGLQAMLDWADKEKKYWSAKEKDSQGAVRQISELKNELEETERGILAKKAELDKFQADLITLEKQISTTEEKQKAITKNANRITELKTLISTLESTAVIDITAMDKELIELNEMIKPVPGISEKVQKFRTEQTKIRNQIKALSKQESDLGGTIVTINQTIQSLDNAIKAVNEQQGRCIAHHMVKCPKNFSDPVLLEGVRKNKEAANKKVSELQAQIDDIKKQVTALENQEKSIHDQISILQKNVSDVNTANTNLNKSIAAVTARKNVAVKNNNERENKIKLYNDELKKLENEPFEEISDIEAIKNQANDMRTKIADLKTIVDQKEKAKQALILVQQSMLDNRKAEYNSISIKLITEELGPKGVQGELVKEILEPIRNDIEDNLNLMGFKCKPFFQTVSDTGKEIFQFGWVNEKGHKVNFDALSTGQQTVFLAAMMVTIIDRAQPKLRLLLMDNLNHLDHINFQMLVDGLSKVKDKLDNIILAGAIEFEFKADNWKVWDLSAAQEVGQVEQSA